MAKRPVSAVPGNKRPVSEYARMAAQIGGNLRYKVLLRNCSYSATVDEALKIRVPFVNPVCNIQFYLCINADNFSQ